MQQNQITECYSPSKLFCIVLDKVGASATAHPKADLGLHVALCHPKFCLLFRVTLLRHDANVSTQCHGLPAANHAAMHGLHALPDPSSRARPSRQTVARCHNGVTMTSQCRLFVRMETGEDSFDIAHAVNAPPPHPPPFTSVHLYAQMLSNGIAPYAIRTTTFRSRPETTRDGKSAHTLQGMPSQDSCRLA